MAQVGRNIPRVFGVSGLTGRTEHSEHIRPLGKWGNILHTKVCRSVVRAPHPDSGGADTSLVPWLVDDFVDWNCSEHPVLRGIVQTPWTLIRRGVSTRPLKKRLGGRKDVSGHASFRRSLHRNPCTTAPPPKKTTGGRGSDGDGGGTSFGAEEEGLRRPADGLAPGRGFKASQPPPPPAPAMLYEGSRPLWLIQMGLTLLGSHHSSPDREFSSTLRIPFTCKGVPSPSTPRFSALPAAGGG